MRTDDPDRGLLRALLQPASRTPWAADEVTSGLDRVSMAAPALLKVGGVALMLLVNSNDLQVISASDDLTTVLDVQTRLGNGPSLVCMRQSEPVAVDDLAVAAPYRPLWQAVAGSGVRAVLSVPVTLAGNTIGTLDAVQHAPHRWQLPQIRAARAYAKVMAVILGSAVRALRADSFSRQLYCRMSLDRCPADEDPAVG